MSAATPVFGAAEGRLHITLHRCGGAVHRAGIVSGRPLHLPRVFEGRTPPQLLSALPLLFSVCGAAQAQAALRACHGALGITPPPTAERARQMLVWLETAREHCWRIGADWPAFCGEAAQGANTLRALAPLSVLPADAKHALFAAGDAFSLDARVQIDRSSLDKLLRQLESLLDGAIFGGALAEWRGIDAPAALDDWIKRSASLPAHLLQRLAENGWEALGRTEASFLPPLSDEKLQRIVNRCPHGDACAAAPRRRSLETGALHRQRAHPLLQGLLPAFGNGLKVRLLARLLELAALPESLRRMLDTMETETTAAASPVYRADGIGLAQVEAARGLLIHSMELQRGVVRRYRILAPTDWNFAPGGVAARSLERLRARNEAELRAQAALLIHAIDPCVGYDLGISDV